MPLLLVTIPCLKMFTSHGHTSMSTTLLALACRPPRRKRPEVSERQSEKAGLSTSTSPPRHSNPVVCVCVCYTQSDKADLARCCSTRAESQDGTRPRPATACGRGQRDGETTGRGGREEGRGGRTGSLGRVSDVSRRVSCPSPRLQAEDPVGALPLKHARLLGLAAYHSSR